MNVYVLAALVAMAVAGIRPIEKGVKKVDHGVVKVSKAVGKKVCHVVVGCGHCK